MAKQFNFEDWLASRKEQLPSLLSPHRKKFDLTANTWMEDPQIWNKAQKAAQIDKSLAKDLALRGDDPTFTGEFISRLDKAIPDITDLAAAEKAAEEYKQFEQWRKSLENKDWLEAKPSEPEAPIGKQIFEKTTLPTIDKSAKLSAKTFLDQTESSPVIPRKELETESAPQVPEQQFTLGESKPAQSILSPEEIQRLRIQNAMKRGGGFTLGETPSSTAPTSEDIIQQFKQKKEQDAVNKILEDVEQSVRKDRPLRNIQASSAGSEGSDFETFVNKEKEINKIVPKPIEIPKEEAPIVQEAAEEIPSSGSVLSDLNSGNVGALSRLSNLLKNPMLKAGLKLGGGLASGAAIYSGGKEALEHLKKDEYSEAIPGALTAASGVTGLLGMPLATAVLSAYPFGKFVSEEMGGSPPENYGQSDKGGGEPEVVPPQPGAILPKPEATPAPKERTRFDDLKDVYEERLKSYPEYKVYRGPSSVGGIEEEPSRSPASIEDEQSKRELPHTGDIKNLTYIRAREHNIPPALALAIADQESSFNPSSPKNESEAGGLMQITPVAYKDVKMHVNPEYLKDKKHEDLMNPRNYDANLRTGLDLINLAKKRENLPDNFDYKNRDNILKISKRFFGSGKHINPNTGEETTAEDYANNLMPKIEAYDKMLGEYEKNNELNVSSKPLSTRAPQSLFDRILESMESLQMEGRPSNAQKMIVDTTNKPTLPFNGDESIVPPSNSPSDNIEVTDTEAPKPTPNKPSDATELVKALQDMSSKDRISDLEAMRAYLQGTPTATIGKALSTIGASIAGAKYGTIPKIEGLEGWDAAERAPASMIKMNEYLKSARMDDPSSAESKAYRKFAAGVLSSVNEDFDESQLEGLSGNSIKTLLPMGVKEDSLLYRKLMAGDKTSEKDRAYNEKVRVANSRMENQANAKFDANTKNEIAKLQGAENAQTLINDIRKNKLVASKTLRQQLSNEVVNLEMPGNLRASVSAQEAGKIDTLYGSLKDTLGYIVSSPTDTIPNDYVDQLEREIKLLRNKYKQFLKTKVDSLYDSYSDPVQQGTIKRRAARFLPESYGEPQSSAKMIRVQTKDGQTGNIPEEKWNALSETEKSNFKVIQ